jgi:hypothetical protein
LDFTTYQESNFLIESKFDNEELPPPVIHPQPNLCFDPPTSSEDTDDSEEPDYRAVIVVSPHPIGSDESFIGSLSGLIHRNISLSNTSVSRESPDILDNEASSTLSIETSDKSELEVPPINKGRPLGVKKQVKVLEKYSSTSLEAALQP